MGWPKGKPRGSRTPGSGRKTGTPTGDTKDLRDMILQALYEQDGGGIAYLKRQAAGNPNAFLTLVGKVLPMAVTGADGAGPLVIEIVKFGEKA